MKVRTKAKKYKVRDIYKLQGLDYIVTDVEEGEIADRLTLSEDATDETISGNIGRAIENGEDITFASRTVCKVLKKLQSKHCIKSIGE